MSKLTVVFPAAAVAFILLIFSLALPLLREPVSFPREGRWRRRRDRLLCALITVVYAVTAFIGLGDTQGIETFCKFRGQGQYALIELPANTYIGAIRYYHGLNAGEYYVEYSDDGEYFTYVASMEARYKDVFKWRRVELSESWGGPVRFVRIIASRPLWLGEVAFYDDRGELIPTEHMIIPDGCAKLFDEQEKIPAVESFMNSTYFDEIYHPRTAFEHIENVEPYEISHPPLGKLLMGIGIRIFGMVPFGWRFMGTLFGVLMLPAIYLFLKRMFGGTLVPACCTAIMASDFLHFAQTRLATIDTYEVLFIILMYGFFWCYWTAPRVRRRDWLPPLALSGVCFGLGAASKWTGFYAGAGLAVLWLIDRVRRILELRREAKARKHQKQRRQEPAVSPLGETVENILWCLLFFVLIPAVIYYVSYWPYGTARGMTGGAGMLFSKDYLRIVLDNQKYMFNYHSGVTATHPYSSVWWQWILDIRPILYYLEYLPGGREQSIGAWMNPLLCWGGLLAMLLMAYLAAAKRDKTALFIFIGYLAQLLPWVFVKRVVFEYHYFPSSVFLLLALGHIFRTVELRYPRPKRVVLSFTIVSIVLFAAFYPALSGITVPRWYDLKFLKWLPTWPF